jgi:oxalate decarboxylase
MVANGGRGKPGLLPLCAMRRARGCSGGRSKIVDVGPGDAVYIPAGFGHAIRNTGDDDLEIVQTWDRDKFEEIDLDRWVRSSPNYLLTNNFTASASRSVS